MRRFRLAIQYLTLALMLSASMTPGTVWGQAHRAILLGQVRDASGSVVPGAEVRVIHKETNTTRSTISNDAGNYEVPGLLPGAYHVEASLPGFKTAAVDDIPVASAQRVTVNLVLEVGEISDKVTVLSDQQILGAVGADVNTVFGQKYLQYTPIGQGHAILMLKLASGANSALDFGGWGMDVQPRQRAGTGLPRFNGSPSGTAEFMIDGTPNTQRGNAVPGGASASNPTSDVVQEVRIQTSTFDASVGHSGGASIDVILKTGTNDFHGSAFAFMRDPEWNANWWDSNRAGQPRPNFVYRRWGFTGGGPVRLGPFYNGKDKTFFFFGWENWSALAPSGTTYATVPRPQHLQGDFSDLLALGPQYQLYDPATARLAPNGRIERSPFPGNIIPAARIHPIAKTLGKFFPAPNQPGTKDGLENFAYELAPYPRGFRPWTVRLDHNLSTAHKLSGRLLYSREPTPSWTMWGNPGIEVNRALDKTKNVGVSDVWTVTPSFVADFRTSVSWHQTVNVPNKGGLSWNDLGLGVEKVVDTDLLGVPSVIISGYPRLTSIGSRPGFQNIAGYTENSEIRTGSANFSKLYRNHSVKFGADIRYYISNHGSDTSLDLTFSGGYSRGPFDNSPAPPHGSALADWLLGTYASAQIISPIKPANLATYQGLYLNDDWKITPRLTLSLGVRYEREGPPTDRFNQAVSGFAFGQDSPIAAAARANYANNPIPELSADRFQVKGGLLFAGVGGQPRTAYDGDNNNFAPRIGLAYQVRANTVVRAGYGVYYIPYGQRFYAAYFATPGFNVNTFSFSSLDGGLTFPGKLENLFPKGQDARQGAALGLSTNLGQGISIPTLARDLRSAYNQRMLLSVQHKFGTSNLLEVRYVSNRTIKMPISKNLNALPNQYLSTSPERDQATIDRLSQLVPNPFRGLPNVGGSLGTAVSTSRAALLLPYPQFGGITVQLPQGWTSYNALQVEFERRMSSGVMFQTSYTFAKTIDALSFLNAGDPLPEKVISPSDRPHIWRLVAVWELPFGKGRRFGSGYGGVIEHLISGWEVSTITAAETGTPIPWGNVIFRGKLEDIPISNPKPERWFNTAAGFEQTAAKQLASNLRTFPTYLSGVRSGNRANTDFSLVKDTYIREEMSVQFRAEAYNLWNEHHYTGNANTGPTSTAFGSTFTVSDPRKVQLGVKFIF